MIFNCTNGIKLRKASYICLKTPVTAFFHTTAIHKIVGDWEGPSDTLNLTHFNSNAIIQETT